MVRSQNTSWQQVQLGDLLTRITYGFTNPMPTTDSGPTMVTAKDIRGGRIDYSTVRHTSVEAFRERLTDKSRPRVGDILLTKDGSIGRVAVCDRDDICINQSVALLQLKSDVNPRFLAYLLQAPRYQAAMAADADGSTIKHIYITRVDKMAIEVPDAVKQKEIADVLGVLDDKIAANERVGRLLDNLGEAAVNQQALTVAPSTVRTVADFLYGKALPVASRTTGIVTVYGSGGAVGTHDTALVDGPGIVVGRKGTVGALYWSDGPHFPIDTTYYVVPKPGVSPHILYYALRAARLSELNSDPAVPGLNRDEAYGQYLRVPLGSDAEQLARRLERDFELAKSLREQTRCLAQTRDQLLPLLMSGRVTVKDVEGTIEDIV